MGVIARLKILLRRIVMECMTNDEFVHYLRKHGIRVGDNVHFRHPAHTTIDFTRPCLIEFGNNIDVNDFFSVLTHDFGTFVFRNYFEDFVNSSGKVVIGNNIVFGQNVTILKGVSIGDNCIIGAGSVVNKSIPANSIAAGVPAKVICSIDDYYKKRKEKQVEEAIQYAKTYYVAKNRDISIEELTEEWCLFITREEYDNNALVRRNVDFRLKGYVDIGHYLKQKKHFAGYKDFIKAVHQSLEEEKR